MPSSFLLLPRWPVAFACWCSTIVLGSVVLASYLANWLLPTWRFFELLPLAISAAGFGALPSLLLLPWGMRWVGAAATTARRRKRLLLLLAGAFSLALGSLFWLGVRGAAFLALCWLTLPYVPAALVSATVAYWPWLRQPVPGPGLS